MTTTVAIVGSHGTGKTTLVAALREALRGAGATVAVVPEASRHILDEVGDPTWFHRRHNSIAKQLLILLAQYGLEDANHSDAADVVICDRSMLDHLAYTRLLYDDDLPAKYWELLTTFVVTHMAVYDHVFYLPPEIDLAADGVRERDLAYRRAVGDRLRQMLDESDLGYEVVTGSVEARLANVLRRLESDDAAG